MKKVLATAIVFTAAAAVLFSACVKSDANNKNTSAGSVNIVNQWFYTTDTIKTYNGATLESVMPYTYYQSNYLQFNSDGTGILYQNSSPSGFTYSFTADTVLTLKFASSPFVNSLPATNALKASAGLNASGPRTLATTTYQETAQIKKLTALNLVLFFTSTAGTTTYTEAAYFTVAE